MANPDPFTSGRRIAARIALAQLGAAAVLALAWSATGLEAALGALIGAGTVAVATAAFAWRWFGRRGGLLRLAGAFALKWSLVVAGLYLGLAVLKLPPLPILTGLVGATAMNLFGLRWTERRAV